MREYGFQVYATLSFKPELLQSDFETTRGLCYSRVELDDGRTRNPLVFG